MEDSAAAATQNSRTPALHRSVPFSFSFQHDLVHSAGFGETNMDALILGGRQVLAHEIRFDGQLAMPAIDQNRELNALGPAKII